MKPVLSTRDLSRIFQVNESSVKRWADLGVLHCFRTPGGHRKFTVDEVLRFARDQKFVLDDEALGVLGVAGQSTRAPGPREIEALGDELLEALTRQNSDAGSRLLLEAHASHLSLETICDSVIRRAVDRLETLREAGQIEPFEERIATMKLIEALVRLSDAIGTVPQSSFHALLACVPGEAHDIDLRCVRLVLQRRGWRVTFLGGTPQEGSIEAAVRRLRPQAVFLCASAPADCLRGLVGSVAVAARDVAARLIVGVRGFHGAAPFGMPGVDLVAHSLAEVDSFAEAMSRKPAG